MDPNADKTFAAKHPSSSKVDPKIEAAIKGKASSGKIACAVAFDIVHRLSVSAEDVGRTIDLLNLHLTKCQLGLFGYQPDKKIVTPAPAIDPQVEASIREASIDNRLACHKAWEIASHFGIRKMVVSSACEALAIKVKPCQLGAF